MASARHATNMAGEGLRNDDLTVVSLGALHVSTLGRVRRRRNRGNPETLRARLLHELVELSVRPAEVDVPVAVVLGRLVDLDARRPQLGDCLVEVCDEKPDRARGVAHAASV